MKLQNLNPPAFKNYLTQITSDVFAKKTWHKTKDQSLSKPCILIVDDDWNMLKLLCNFLSDQYGLVVKPSPIQALNWIHEGNHPALIICEYNHQHFNSASFIQIVKGSGLYHHTPVIILSHVERVEEKILSMPFKVEGIISKPFDPVHLKKIIQKILHGNEPRLNH
jgi:DNA-binding NtrC family response regulator